MQGSLAQSVALTCHGNAAIHGMSIPEFFPLNSTCPFCEQITFIAGGGDADGKQQSITLADTPNQWLRMLPGRRIQRLRLHQRAQNDPRIPDRMSTAFVGGGRVMEDRRDPRKRDQRVLANQVGVGNRDAADRRIWRVVYGLVAIEQTTVAFPLRPLEIIGDDLRVALHQILAFAEDQKSGFAANFADALKVLDDPDADIGYHKDLAPTGALGPLAVSLLKAAQRAWVFGRMGSWNDMEFAGEIGRSTTKSQSNYSIC